MEEDTSLRGSPVTKSEIDDDNAQVVNAIILWRIYDVLLLILSETGGPEIAGKVALAHERGEFIGPGPSLNIKETDDE
jgi:hypothetical protein